MTTTAESHPEQPAVTQPSPATSNSGSASTPAAAPRSRGQSGVPNSGHASFRRWVCISAALGVVSFAGAWAQG